MDGLKRFTGLMVTFLSLSGLCASSALADKVVAETQKNDDIKVSVVADDADDTRDEEVREIVSRAIALYKAEGAEKAFAEMNANPNDFVDDNIYLFVVNDNNVVVVHAMDPSIVGKTVAEYQTPQGRKVLELAKTVATPEGTWTDQYNTMDDDGESEPKRSWVVLYDSYVFGGAVADDEEAPDDLSLKTLSQEDTAPQEGDILQEEDSTTTEVSQRDMPEGEYSDAIEEELNDPYAAEDDLDADDVTQDPILDDIEHPDPRDPRDYNQEPPSVQ